MRSAKIGLNELLGAMLERTSNSHTDDGVITESDARALVEILCAKYGFCLSPLWRARLSKNPPQFVRKFTDTVFCAEGLNPETADTQLYNAIETEVRQAFERSAKNQITR